MARPKPKYIPALLRILSRCKIIPNGCHVWPGATSGFGYPVANVNGRGTFTYLHVATYLLFRGDIPEGFEVDHACSNKRCLNPEHLQALSHGDNISREGTVGRQRKFDPSEIVRLQLEGLSDAAIAEELGTSSASIQLARRQHGIKR